MKNIITQLDVNKPNNDVIPAIFYKQTMENIIKPLTIIFKIALYQITYPDAFKVSYVTLIHKSSFFDNIENYRSISLLPTIAEIFHKLIFNHINKKTRISFRMLRIYGRQVHDY